MTKSVTTSKARKQSWFAPRQVYLRTSQGSSYVELSTPMQVSVAIGFGLVTLWLLGASYSAARHVMDQDSKATLLAKLESSQEKLVEMTEEAAKIPDLEAALDDANASVVEAQQRDETAALSAELAQTQKQLEKLRVELSKAKSEEASLQAKLEGLAKEGKTTNSQAAEEVASLHSQLEKAFIEIEDLETARDEADAKVAALKAANAENNDDAERNQTLLKAATEEIERLQKSIAEDSRAQDEQEAELLQEVDRLTAALDEEKAARTDLQQQADNMLAELKRRNDDSAKEEKLRVVAAAERHASAIAADLKEADLLATIEDLHAEVGSQERDTDNQIIDELKGKLAIAEAEIEKLLKNTLAKANDSEDVDVAAAAVPSTDDAGNAEEIERLETELSTAKGEIIKLNADVRAAKRRLAEQSETRVVTEAKPDNTAKLEQQLASTRSRMQQLNKALADAKLREVAIDLALISVVPSPSPPAPR
ncbi:MAG: hypothetical protein ACR2QF_07760 [Geminicoccaceae bacterium]